MPNQTCGRCGLEKDVEAFGWVWKGKERYRRGVCRECHSARRRVVADFEITVDEPPDARPTAPEMPLPAAIAAMVAPAWKGRADFFTAAPLEPVLFIPDVHRPYHDHAAWELLLRAAAVLQPKKVVVLGDFCDFYSVSSFDKHPKRILDLKEEADDVNAALDQLDRLGATTRMFIAGNHEDRLERYLCKSAPALIGCVSVKELLHLDERGWQYTPYKRSTRLGKLHLTHDTGTAGINAHRQSMEAFQGSVLIGHTHRMEYSVRGNADGPPHLGAMFGWLGDFDQVDYMQNVKARRDWVHGFGIGFQEPDTGVIHVQPVPIINGSCCVLGRLVR